MSWSRFRAVSLWPEWSGQMTVSDVARSPGKKMLIHDCGRLRVREEPTGSRVIKTERNGSQTTWLTSSDQPVHSFMPWPSHALPKPRWGLYTLQIPLCMPWGGLHKAWIGGVKAGCDEVVEVARAHSASMPHPRSDALACFYQRSSRQTDVRAEQIKNHKHAKKYDRHLTNWGLFKHQRVFFFFFAKKRLNEASGIDIWGVIGLDDSYLSVWCWVGSAMGQGGGDRVLSGRLADKCGTKLRANRVNESWRASEATGWFIFQYYPSVSLVWERKRCRGQRVASQNQWKRSERQITCCWTVRAGFWWEIGDIRPIGTFL